MVALIEKEGRVILVPVAAVTGITTSTPLVSSFPGISIIVSYDDMILVPCGLCAPKAATPTLWVYGR